MNEKYSSDYDCSKIKMDKRFIICKKDAVLSLFSYLAVIVLTWVVANYLNPADASDMTYLFGFPTWVTVGFLINVLFSVFVIIWSAKSKKISLDAKGDDREVE